MFADLSVLCGENEKEGQPFSGYRLPAKTILVSVAAGSTSTTGAAIGARSAAAACAALGVLAERRAASATSAALSIIDAGSAGAAGATLGVLAGSRAAAARAARAAIGTRCLLYTSDAADE